jgi:hypothetical protein
MKKNKKIYYLIVLGIVFLLVGAIITLDDSNIHPFIYFGIGTLAATALYYGVMAKRSQITAFLVGLIVLHTGVLLIIKGELAYPEVFGLVTFISGILVLLNSGFSEYIRDRKNKG